VKFQRARTYDAVRLLVIEPIETAKAASIVVIQHWDEALKRLLPAK
jgi:hypothetical protein